MPKKIECLIDPLNSVLLASSGKALEMLKRKPQHQWRFYHHFVITVTVISDRATSGHKSFLKVIRWNNLPIDDDVNKNNFKCVALAAIESFE